METGERIRQLRTQRNMPQQALADSLGVTRQAVAKWESGASRPSAANLMALCRLFGVSWQQLAGPGGAPQRAARRARRLCAALGLLAAALAALCAAAWVWERARALPPRRQSCLWRAHRPCYMCCRLWRALRPWRPPQPFCI